VPVFEFCCNNVARALSHLMHLAWVNMKTDVTCCGLVVRTRPPRSYAVCWQLTPYRWLDDWQKSVDRW